MITKRSAIQQIDTVVRLCMAEEENKEEDQVL